MKDKHHSIMQTLSIIAIHYLTSLTWFSTKMGLLMSFPGCATIRHVSFTCCHHFLQLPDSRLCVSVQGSVRPLHLHCAAVVSTLVSHSEGRLQTRYTCGFFRTMLINWYYFNIQTCVLKHGKPRNQSMRDTP